MHERVRRGLVMLVALGLALVARPVAAQAPVAARITQASFAKFPTLDLYLSVNDNAGNPLTGLPASAFKVTEAGRPVPTFDLKPVERTEGLTLVLALDVSNSMGEGPAPTALDQAKQAATRFLDSLGPNDRVVLIPFSGDVARPGEFSADKAQVKAQVAGLTVGPYTALYEAVAQAAERFEVATPGRADPNAPGRKAVVVLTDGLDNPRPGGRTRSLDDAITLARDRQTPVFALGFGQVADKELERLAAETGGQFLRAPGAADLGALFNRLAGQLQNQYVLTYRSGLTSPGDYPVTVDVARPQGAATATYLLRFAGFVVPQTVIVPVPITLTPPPPSATPPPAATPTSPPPTLAPTLATTLAPLPTATPCPLCLPPERQGLLGLVALLAAGLVGAFVWAMRRPKPAPPAPPPPTPPPVTPAPPPPAPMPTMVARRRDDRTQVMNLRPGPIAWLARADGGQEDRLGSETTIGRAGDNTVVLDDARVSRYHAIIKLEGGKYVLQDRGASNPTEVNGRPILRHELQDGDEILLGDTRLVFKFIQPIQPTQP